VHHHIVMTVKINNIT